MDLEIINQMLVPTIVVGCLCVGYVIKSFHNSKLNQFIPCICCLLGIVASAFLGQGFDLTTAIGGAVSGLAATGLFEAFRNILHLDEVEPDQ